MKTIYLVCPNHFNVNYVINPWMEGNINTVDKTLAMQQWNTLVATLNVIGVNTVILPEAPNNCPDAVFSANAGLIIGDLFIASTFKHLDRVPEEDYFAKCFSDLKYIVFNLGETIKFEGAGDALFTHDGKYLFLGKGRRTDTEAYNQLIEPSNKYETVQLELVNPDFYHLDTCFCPLDTGDLLWFPQAFSPVSIDRVRVIYPDEKLISVESWDAAKFGCNSISVGNRIVMPMVSSLLQTQLEDRGYVVHCVDMSEYLKSGGGPKCCTLQTN